jgi:hypothetical protein
MANPRLLKRHWKRGRTTYGFVGVLDRSISMPQG